MAGGGWRVTGGGWRVAGGEWRVAGGGWRVASGGWRVAGGEWRVAGGEWRVAGLFRDSRFVAPSGDPIISFPRSAWECRPGRSASLRPAGRPTQSVEDGIPTGSVGTSSRSSAVVLPSWTLQRPCTRRPRRAWSTAFPRGPWDRVPDPPRSWSASSVFLLPPIVFSWVEVEAGWYLDDQFRGFQGDR